MINLDNLIFIIHSLEVLKPVVRTMRPINLLEKEKLDREVGLDEIREDKQAFHEACRRHGLPSVPSIESREDALAVLESGGALFAKPRLLQWGWGACIIKSAQDPKLDEILAKPEEFLLQERLQNRADFRGCLSPDAPMCTARITTFWTPEGYKVLESWIRCGASGATADHMENGGTSFAVFAETGVVWKGTSGELMRTPGQAPLQPTIRRAKGAERDISGERLPNWEETVQTCMRAHAAVAKDAFTVGWDIAFTDRGTYLVEANLLSMVSLHIGMRFGNMAMLFPDSPLVNVAMAEWLCDKPGGVPRTALRARLEAARQETKELLSATTSEADSTKISVTGRLPMNCPGMPGQNSMGRKAQSVVAVDETTGQNMRLAAST